MDDMELKDRFNNLRPYMSHNLNVCDVVDELKAYNFLSISDLQLIVSKSSERDKVRELMNRLERKNIKVYEFLLNILKRLGTYEEMVRRIENVNVEIPAQRESAMSHSQPRFMPDEERTIGVLHGLPFFAKGLLNRPEYIDSIRHGLMKLLDAPVGCLLVYGWNGPCKTILAAEAVYDDEICQKYSGGIFWISDAQSERVAERLGNTLLVFDGVRPNCELKGRVMVISRDDFDVGLPEHLVIKVMLDSSVEETCPLEMYQEMKEVLRMYDLMKYWNDKFVQDMLRVMKECNFSLRHVTDPTVRAMHYDGVILYAEVDRDAAVGLANTLMHEVRLSNGGNVKILTMEESCGIADPAHCNLHEWMTEAIDYCNFFLFYMSKDFLDGDVFHDFHFNLFRDSVTNEKARLIPIYPSKAARETLKNVRVFRVSPLQSIRGICLEDAERYRLPKLQTSFNSKLSLRRRREDNQIVKLKDELQRLKSEAPETRHVVAYTEPAVFRDDLNLDLSDGLTIDRDMVPQIDISGIRDYESIIAHPGNAAEIAERRPTPATGTHKPARFPGGRGPNIVYNIFNPTTMNIHSETADVTAHLGKQ